MAAVKTTALTDNINSDSHVLNITVGSLTNPVLMVCSSRSSRGIDSVSSDVDGALTLVDTLSDFDFLDWYILKNPTAGAHVITFGLNGTARGRLAGYVIDDVDQTTSTGTAATGAGGGSDTSATLAVASSVGDIVVGAIIVPNGSETITQDGGETGLGGDQTWVVGTSDFVYEAGDASSTDLDWGWSGSLDYIASGVAVLDSGGGGGSNGGVMRRRRSG